MKYDDASLMHDMDAWLAGTPVVDATAALIVLAAKGIAAASSSHEMLEEGIKIACGQLARTARKGYDAKEVK